MAIKVEGNLVDVFRREIYPAEIIISGSRIDSIRRLKGDFKRFILPGFIDSHVHIESSMLTPAGFAELAVRHGTVAVISDPHEIANVSGIKGIDFMIRDGNSVPLKFYFGAPSCVPATDYETSGARLDPDDINYLLERGDVHFLAEVMNYPAVLNKNKDLIKKLDSAKRNSKPIDGHAPGLRGDDLREYINAGIDTDHESMNIDEADEKILAGMKVQIREGSAAKCFDSFCSLIQKFPGSVMLCSDDLHPDDLVKGHINTLFARGIKNGINIYDLIRASTVTPVDHYKIPVGMLRKGDYADFVIVKDLIDFKVCETYIDGKLVFANDSVLFSRNFHPLQSTFSAGYLSEKDILVESKEKLVKVIEIRDKELYTGCKVLKLKSENDLLITDVNRDICKIAVVNRYFRTPPSVGFITGFGLRKGALASSIAHDSHNIIAVGVDDASLVKAINCIVDLQGGLSVVFGDTTESLQLEIAGLMTNDNGEEVAQRYKVIDNLAKLLGSCLTAPFMSLSFMALLVIPELKISDRGLFDVNRFNFTSLFAESDQN